MHHDNNLGSGWIWMIFIGCWR